MPASTRGISASKASRATAKPRSSPPHSTRVSRWCWSDRRAMAAPRWVFVSYGIPEKGDANWLDHQGSYMAAIAAGPVFRLLGVRDLGDTRDYHVATMPGVNVGLVNGELAWRQHDGGHEDRSNITHFIEWADRLRK